MKIKTIAFVGAIALLAGSVLSCSLGGSTSAGDETNPDNYTEITEDEAETIISNFDAQAAFEEVETLTISMDGIVTYNSEEVPVEEGYDVDFRDESLYIYGYISSTETSIRGSSFLITGSGDSYIYQYVSSGVLQDNEELTFEEAKALHSEYWSYLASLVIYDEDFIYEMADSYGYETDITYSTYGDYIMLKISYEVTVDDTTISLVNYVVYNGQGLLRYGESEISVISETFTMESTFKYDAEYNITLDRKTSLQ